MIHQDACLHPLILFLQRKAGYPGTYNLSFDSKSHDFKVIQKYFIFIKMIVIRGENCSD